MTAPAADQLPGRTEVLVVGGGIQGAGIAQAAAAAGYNTVLVEKAGWAVGTSSKSSKLIHGGLRYLEQLQLGLVYESLRERDILSRIAPHLVRLNRFYVPIYRETHVRPWKLRAGLSLYALLGRLGASKRFHTLPRQQWPLLEGLEQEGLQAVFQYWDGQTDDARLTKAVVASARQLGATIACPAELISATATASGYRAVIRRGNEHNEIDSRVVINAAGPWVDQVAERIAAAPRPTFAMVQGSHLVLNRQLSDACYYLEAPRDRRAVFVLPWHGKTLVGTTETPYRGDPSLAHCTPEEEAYLLETLYHYFPSIEGSTEVIERMAGLRVLPGGEDEIHGRTRDVMIDHCFVQGRAYISVCGGKLTGYRAAAEAVVNRVHRHLGKRERVADTATLTLPDLIA